MAAFVLDCSMTMAWVFPDEATASTDALRDSMVQESAAVPALWPMEVANVLLMATRRGRVTEDEWGQIRADLATLPIEIDSVSYDRILGSSLALAHEHEISVYDAIYLELALRLGLPLATLDRKLSTAGKAAGVRVLAGL